MIQDDYLLEAEIGIIRQFMSFQRAVILVIVLCAILFTAAAAICLNIGEPLYRSAVWPLSFFIIVFLLYAGWLWRRATALIADSSENLAQSYFAAIEETVNRVIQTRNLSAIVLLITVVGLMVSCLITWLKPLLAGWGASVMCSALLTLIAYYHIFRLEIHAQDLRRSIRMRGGDR